MQKVTRDNINSLLRESGIRPSKDKGQNFLVNPEIAEKIVNLVKSEQNSPVLEVGPGLGSLTYFLKNKFENLYLIDIDRNAVNFLIDNKFSNNVFLADALLFNVDGYEYIISNLPYYITNDLVVYLLCNAEKCKQFVFMCQKEKLPHFIDVQGSEYGPSSILIHLLGDIKKEFDVSPHNFYPAPECVSSVFTIDVKEFDRDKREEIIGTYHVANRLFTFRRKTILNAFKAAFGDEKSDYILEKAGIEKHRRPEEIKPLEYLCLYKIMSDVNLF